MGACRAEATDVANAVLDGVDGILLGAETLRGSYPVQTVQTVLSIARSAEAVFDHEQHFEMLMATALEVRCLLQDADCAEHAAHCTMLPTWWKTGNHLIHMAPCLPACILPATYVLHDVR